MWVWGKTPSEHLRVSAAPGERCQPWRWDTTLSSTGTPTAQRPGQRQQLVSGHVTSQLRQPLPRTRSRSKPVTSHHKELGEAKALASALPCSSSPHNSGSGAGTRLPETEGAHAPPARTIHFLPPELERQTPAASLPSLRRLNLPPLRPSTLCSQAQSYIHPTLPGGRPGVATDHVRLL